MRSKHETQADPASGRIIKKYPNRRLYDTLTSSYITLAEVKQMVMDNVPVVVLDAKSQEDLTRSILLQIILEEESAGIPLFSEATLANIIRFYGHAMQGYMGQILERNMQQFMDLQRTMADQPVPMTPEAWMKMVQDNNPFVQGFNAYTDQMLGAMGIKR